MDKAKIADTQEIYRHRYKYRCFPYRFQVFYSPKKEKAWNCKNAHRGWKIG